MFVNIKHIPKEDLLFELWKVAKKSEFHKYTEGEPCKEIVQFDIHNMKLNNSIDMSLYYGKLLHINLSYNMCDVTEYNLYNGEGLAQKVISKLKHKELEKIILNYYISY